MRGLRALTVFAAVVGSWAAITLIRGRYSLLYLALAAALVLPVASWFRARIGPLALSFALVAWALALSPVDFMTRSTGTWSLRLLPVSEGLVCDAGTACRDRVLREGDPTLALVLGH